MAQAMGGPFFYVRWPRAHPMAHPMVEEVMIASSRILFVGLSRAGLPRWGPLLPKLTLRPSSEDPKVRRTLAHALEQRGRAPRDDSGPPSSRRSNIESELLPGLPAPTPPYPMPPPPPSIIPPIIHFLAAMCPAERFPGLAAGARRAATAGATPAPTEEASAYYYYTTSSISAVSSASSAYTTSNTNQ